MDWAVVAEDADSFRLRCTGSIDFLVDRAAVDVGERRSD
jgi:hypothetical protein